MAGRDIGAALFLLVSAVLLLWFVIPAETIPGDEGELPQAFMPSLAAVALAAAAALILLRAAAALLRDRRSGKTAIAAPAREDGPAPPEEAAIGGAFWAVLAGSLLFFTLILVLLEQMGFIAGSGAAILVVGLAFNRRSVVAVGALAILLPAASHVLVLYGLGLALP